MKNFLYNVLAAMVVPMALFAVAERDGDTVNTMMTVSQPITRILPISARRQWDDNEGYCGETCIQSFAMYFGTYISQYQVRAMIDPKQEDEVVISQNEEAILDNLHLTHEQWNYSDRPTPQYQSYLAWAKRQINDGHPVIGTVYMKKETDPDFDHIVPFIGFQTNHEASGYYRDDKLIFFDNYSRSSFSRPFRTMYGSRREASEGTYDYYIPEEYDYGCAITGIVDPQHETVPVRLSIDRWDEPNLVAGKDPVILHGTVTIQPLVAGKAYDLLRYDDYRKVPDAQFLSNGGYSWRHRFTATSAMQTLTDDFMSNSCVIYRCVAE
jgi:hypothetical protein